MARLTSQTMARLTNVGRSLILFLVPICLVLLLLGLPHTLTSKSPAQRKTLAFQLGWVFVFFLSGIYWMLNTVHIAAAAFLPLALIPLLGTVDSKRLSYAFMSDHNVVVFGSIVLMMAIDNCGLRKRITLTIMKHSSGSIRWILIDIFLVAIWVAMWINSAAATYLAMKIIDDVLDTLKTEVSNGAMGEERMIVREPINSNKQKDSPKDLPVVDFAASAENSPAAPEIVAYEKQELNAVAIERYNRENEHLLNEFGGELMYVAAVAANIGGMLWPFGNPMGAEAMKLKYAIPKMDVKGKVAIHGLTDASWMLYSWPLVIINGSLAFLYLFWIHFGKRSKIKNLLVGSKQRISNFTQCESTLKRVGKIYSEKRALLPPWSRREKIICFLVILGIFLCRTRLPIALTGWAELVRVRHDDGKTCDGLRISIGDSVSYVILVLLAFLVPSWGLQTFKGPPPDGSKPKGSASIGWKQVQSTYPFTVVILIGTAGCIGKFSDGPIGKPVASYLAKTIDAKKDSTLLKLVMMLITVVVTVLLPNPGSSIAVTQLWFKLMKAYKKVGYSVHGASLLPVLSVASLCFVIPSSSVPTTLIYTYNGTKILSIWYFLRVGVPLLLLTLIPTILYGFLWTPESLAITFIT